MTVFNFRDVVQALGIPEDTKTHWRVGQHLQRIAAKHGIEPLRVLTEKTNPNATVKAPHCIAHYPMSMYRPALEEIGAQRAEDRRQGVLFEVEDLFGESA